MKKPYVIFALALFAATAAMAQMAPDNVGPAADRLPPVLRNVGFEPPLNGALPLDTVFRDETGREVHLRDYFQAQKPVLLAFVYFGCPMLCNEVENGVVGALRMISFNPGRDYEVIFLSFDPRETPEMAAQKKKAELAHFNRPETAAGWHFLVGSQDSIDAVTKAANFRYTFDQKSNLFAHASGIMLLTPDGRISRYFYGVEYPSRDLRLGLIDASSGKIGTPADHLLLYCFHYDPSTAKYSASILKILRLAGVLTIFGIVAGILIFRRRETHSDGTHSRRSAAGDQGAH
jgi:protein SCO1/2